jgi:hypothetical protein
MSFVALAVALLAQSPASGPARPAAPPSTAAAPVARPPAPPGLSWEDADTVTQTVARVERRVKTGRPASSEPIVVTERQLNSYVNLALAPRLPQGITNLELRLQKDRVNARGLLDLDRVKGKVKGGGAAMLALLSGTVPVQLTGRVLAANGTGRLEVEEAVVGGVSLPPSMVAQMILVSTRSAKRPEGIDILAPFALPWTARSIRFEPGRALVDFAR